MTDWFKYLIPVISLLLLAVPFRVIESMNLKEHSRWIQERFVRWALIYVFLVICCFRQISGLVRGLLAWNALRPYLNIIAPLGAFDYAVALFGIILVNAVIFFIFAIIKRIVKIGTDKVKAPSDWTEMGLTGEGAFQKYYWTVLNWVYHLDGRGHYLRADWVKVKQTLKYCVRALIFVYALTVIFLEIPFIYYAAWPPIGLMRQIISAAYIWPAISLLPVAEFAWFLDGNEQDEFNKKTGKQKTENTDKTDYCGLEEEYKNRFKGRYIGTYKISAPDSSDFIYSAASSEPVVEGIRKKLLENNLAVNPAFIRCIENLTQGRDVIIDASIYSDFGEYLYRYLNVVLARGETVLFICPDVQQTGQLHKYTEERLKFINSYHHIWKMKSLTEQSGPGLEDIDVLFATLRFVLNENVFNGFNSFFEKLSAVIIINAAEVTARDSILLSTLGFKLTNDKKNRGNAPENIRYICLSESFPPGVRKAIVEALQLPAHLSTGGVYPARGNATVMLWRYEDLENKKIRAQDAIFAYRSEAYWGFALPLASVALKHGIDTVGIFPGPAAPCKQMLDSMKGSRQKLDEFFERIPVDLDAQIAFNRYNIDNRYIRLAVIDDRYFNLPLTLYSCGRYGGVKASMIHAVSGAYMLRDFFFANAETYLNNESSIHMFMPAVADTKRLSVFRLLYQMRENGLPESEIRERVSRWAALPSDKTDSERTVSALRSCLQALLRRERVDSVYNYFEFKRAARFRSDLNGGDFEECYIVRLKNNSVIEDLLSLNKFAVIQIRENKFYADFFSDGVLQRHLPDQYMVFDGYIYKIKDIDPENGIIHLTEGSDNCDVPTRYTQIRTYVADNASAKKITARTRRFGLVWDAMAESYTITYYRMPVTVKTNGYFTHPITGEPLSFMEKPQIDGESDCEMQRKALRTYAAASVLSLKFIGNFGANPDKAAFLLAAVMNELFKTWFPHSYTCVAVCPILKNPDAIYSDEYGKYIAKVYPQIEITQNDSNDNGIEFFIIEDSATDLGVIQALADSWQELFTRMFENIREYLNWQQSYKEQGGANITNRYLYFGKDGEPDCFDFKTLVEMFNELSAERRAGAEDIGDSSVSHTGACSFCGEPLTAADFTGLADGRKMCGGCTKLIVTDPVKLQELYNAAADYLLTEFGASISDNIKVRFASAESIRLRMRAGDERTVIGFADPNIRELWVESDSPAINLSQTLVHELTHFWQFDNINCNDLDYIEGHASIAEVQYLRKLGQEKRADRIEADLETREDNYGRGFRKLEQELSEQGNRNSFTYMKQKFGKGA